MLLVRTRSGIPIWTTPRSHRNTRRPRLLAIAALVALLLTLSAGALRGSSNLPATVLQWSDGDTVRVRLHTGHTQRVRLIGIDAPEASASPRARNQARRLHVPVSEIVRLGLQAMAYAERLAPPGTSILLELDLEHRDRYGRLLAYVWTQDTRMVNEEMLRSGWALLLTVPPNVRYVERLRAAQRDAIEHRRGLWAGGGR